MTREDFQHLLHQAEEDETILLDAPRERPGPVVVNHRLTLDGAGRGAIWARTGPVLHVQDDDVTLRNLRVEYTGDGDGIALKIDRPNVILEGVTVRGRVEGLAVERGEWRYPHQLNLGTIAHGMPHTLRLRLVVPVPCQLTSEITGVKLQPRTLTPGPHEVLIRIDAMTRDTLVYGTISIRTTFLRREIVLNAHVLSPREGLEPPSTEQNRVVWEAADWANVKTTELPPPLPVHPPDSAPMPQPVTPAAKPIAPPYAPVAKPTMAKPVVPPSLPIRPPAPVSLPVASQPQEETLPVMKIVKKPQLGSVFVSPPVVPEPTESETTPPAEPPPVKPKKKPSATLPAWVSPPPK